MMIELRDRIRAQGTLPDLGDGWGSAVVLRPAGGSSFGGDFVVSYSDGKTLEVALVDVSGKGMDAATRALLLSGAFGGMLGSVPRERFLPACNAYLRRGKAPEGFVTAVHLTVDLASGSTRWPRQGTRPLPASTPTRASGGSAARAASCSAWFLTWPAPTTSPTRVCSAAATRSCSTPTGW